MANRIEISFQRLTAGNSEMGATKRLSPQIKALYFDRPILLEKQLRDYIAAIKALVDCPDDKLNWSNPHTRYILTASKTTLLNSLDVLVKQYREFERVGDSKPIKVNVRFIAATNQDVRNKVKRGKFREDLYYRLKVVELHLPSLRERIEDIPLLVDSFVEKFNKKFNKNVKSVSADVLKIFMDYPWPGNVRELQHVLEYPFVLCNKSIITKDFLPSDIPHGNIGSRVKVNPSKNKKRYDKQTVLQALEKSGWNRSKAARLLGVNRRTVYLKIKEYGLVENGTI